jgi:hypothetical protein
MNSLAQSTLVPPVDPEGTVLVKQTVLLGAPGKPDRG